jgi:hypothetical protein
MNHSHYTPSTGYRHFLLVKILLRNVIRFPPTLISSEFWSEFRLKFNSIRIPIETYFYFRQNYWYKLSKSIKISILESRNRISDTICNRNRNWLILVKNVLQFRHWYRIPLPKLEFRRRNRNSDVGIEIPMWESKLRFRNRNSEVKI